MKKIFRLLGLIFGGVLCVLGFDGCQTRDGGSWGSVDFVSTPEGATVFINGRNCGLTPHTERLSCSQVYEVRFSLPGYFDENSVLEAVPGIDGRPEFPDRLECNLVKITPETRALRERLMREKLPADVTGRDEKTGSVRSFAAIEFAKREPPTNFAEFRLREKDLERLFRNGEITEEEYRLLHEKLNEAALPSATRN